jgi:hypothetical protein
MVFGYITRRDEQSLRVQSENAIKANAETLRLDVDRQLQETRARLEQAGKTHEAELRLLVDRQVQTARGEVERDLKSHEIRQRVEADLRLKLIDRVLNDVSLYRGRLTVAFNSIYLVTQEAEPNGNTARLAELIEEANRAFVAVPNSAAYVPSEILEPAIVLFNEAHDCFRQVVRWAQLPAREERRTRSLETNAKIEEIALRARSLLGADPTLHRDRAWGGRLPWATGAACRGSAPAGE